MEAQELRELLDRWNEEEEQQALQLDLKLAELKDTLNQLKNLQARMMELV